MGFLHIKLSHVTTIIFLPFYRLTADLDWFFGGKVMLRRTFFVICMAFLFTCILFLQASANDGELFGSPVVEENGHMKLDGWNIDLWGVNGLAADQKCWRDEKAWDCGEEAAIALQHYISGKLVKCKIKETAANERIATAQCSFDNNGKPNDIARYMVSQGWAMDDSEQSGNFYNVDEQEARQHRRGIWTSRFQTAEDWKEGVERYVEYEMEPEPQPVTNVVNETVVNTVVISNPVIMLPPRHRHQPYPMQTTATHPELLKNTGTGTTTNAPQPEKPKLPEANSVPIIEKTATQPIPESHILGKMPAQPPAKAQILENTATSSPAEPVAK